MDYLFTCIHVLLVSKIHWTITTCLVMNNYLHDIKKVVRSRQQICQTMRSTHLPSAEHLYAGREISGAPECCKDFLIVFSVD